MQVIATLEGLRAAVARARRNGARIGLVPTMGNLHTGHLSLLEIARGAADFQVASIFVNPLQFGGGEDLDTYPRTLEADLARLGGAGVDLVFTPTAETLYPRGLDDMTRVQVPGFSDILCGEHRPGHFTGVATVVSLLFNLVQPDVAVFGEKDYQQLLVIRRLVADLGFPVEILPAPIVREPDGLAMSSRNGYLNERERAVAPMFHQVLREMAGTLVSGGVPHQARIDDAMTRLCGAGFRPEYIEVRSAQSLKEPAPEDLTLVILGAAYLGTTRLIDNVVVEREKR